MVLVRRYWNWFDCVVIVSGIGEEVLSGATWLESKAQILSAGIAYGKVVVHFTWRLVCTSVWVVYCNP